MSTLTEII